jgi:membrane associated rhomboid family serine protease
MTYLVMGVTFLVTMAAFSIHGLFRAFRLSPHEVATKGAWHQVVTSGFLHADFGHLFFNMFTLYFFGRGVERLLDPRSFALIYLGSLVGGSLLTVARHRGDPSYHAVGASGAVSGILFSFILFEPMARIHVFLIPVGIPAVLFALGYILISVFGMKSGARGIGHDAHLGGALAGAALTILIHPQVISRFLSRF